MGITKILFVSSHEISKEQKEVIQRRFGDNCIVERNNTIVGDAKEIIRRFKENDYQELIVNSSIEVLEELLKKGIHPIIIKMQRSTEPHGNKFTSYKRLIGIMRIREEVKVDKNTEERKILWWANTDPHESEIVNLKLLFGSIKIINKKVTGCSIEEIIEYMNQEKIFKLVVKTKSRWLLLRLKEFGIPYISPVIDNHATAETVEWISHGKYYRLKGYFYTHRELIEEDI